MEAGFVYRRKGILLPLPDELSVIMAVHLVLLALSFAPLCAETTEQRANATSMFACADEDEGKLRVHGTILKSTGHLEICHDRTWGVICANNWGKHEADVSCRQLGFSTAKPIDPSVLKKWQNLSHPNYTKGSGPRKAWLDHILCSGNENDILQCRYGWLRRYPAKEAYKHVNQRSCFDKEELAGVMCSRSEVKQETSSSPSSSSRSQMDVSSLTTAARLHSTFSGESQQLPRAGQPTPTELPFSTANQAAENAMMSTESEMLPETASTFQQSFHTTTEPGQANSILTESVSYNTIDTSVIASQSTEQDEQRNITSLMTEESSLVKCTEDGPSLLVPFIITLLVAIAAVIYSIAATWFWQKGKRTLRKLELKLALLDASKRQTALLASGLDSSDLLSAGVYSTNNVAIASPGGAIEHNGHADDDPYAAVRPRMPTVVRYSYRHSWHTEEDDSSITEKVTSCTNRQGTPVPEGHTMSSVGVESNNLSTSWDEFESETETTPAETTAIYSQPARKNLEERKVDAKPNCINGDGDDCADDDEDEAPAIPVKTYEEDEFCEETSGQDCAELTHGCGDQREVTGDRPREEDAQDGNDVDTTKCTEL